MYHKTVHVRTYTRKSELTNLGFSLPAVLDKLAAFLESYKGLGDIKKVYVLYFQLFSTQARAQSKQNKGMRFGTHIIIWCHLNSNMSTSYIFSGIESGSPATAHPE